MVKLHITFLVLLLIGGCSDKKQQLPEIKKDTVPTLETKYFVEHFPKPYNCYVISRSRGEFDRGGARIELKNYLYIYVSIVGYSWNNDVVDATKFKTIKEAKEQLDLYLSRMNAKPDEIHNADSIIQVK